MGVYGEFRAWSELLTLPKPPQCAVVDDRPNCPYCGIGKLNLVDVWPDPNFGALGVTYEIVKCDAGGCGKLAKR